VVVNNFFSAFRSIDLEAFFPVAAVTKETGLNRIIYDFDFELCLIVRKNEVFFLPIA
jgi:hypothetical protein